MQNLQGCQLQGIFQSIYQYFLWKIIRHILNARNPAIIKDRISVRKNWCRLASEPGNSLKHGNPDLKLKIYNYITSYVHIVHSKQYVICSSEKLNI